MMFYKLSSDEYINIDSIVCVTRLSDDHVLVHFARGNSKGLVALAYRGDKAKTLIRILDWISWDSPGQAES